jgi:hypothetical protein
MEKKSIAEKQKAKPEPLPDEVKDLLRELRSFLANSGDSWEKRLDLMLRINRLVPGGETDVFLGSVREMTRLGTSYANLSQYMSQFMATQQATANVTDLFARILMPNLSAPAQPADFFKQMTDWMSVYGKPPGGGGK